MQRGRPDGRIPLGPELPSPQVIGNLRPATDPTLAGPLLEAGENKPDFPALSKSLRWNRENKYSTNEPRVNATMRRMVNHHWWRNNDFSLSVATKINPEQLKVNSTVLE